MWLSQACRHRAGLSSLDGVDENNGRGWPEAKEGILSAQSAQQPLPRPHAPLRGGRGRCTPQEAAVGPGFLTWGCAEWPGPLRGLSPSRACSQGGEPWSTPTLALPPTEMVKGTLTS